jgi:malate dehydrogenase
MVGGIGQPLSLLLKLSPLVDELALYDVVNSPGVSADLSHINTDSVVKSYLKPKEGEDTPLEEALTGADIIVIPAGVPRKVPSSSKSHLTVAWNVP